jgi:hypothetical protein
MLTYHQADLSNISDAKIANKFIIIQLPKNIVSVSLVLDDK